MLNPENRCTTMTVEPGRLTQILQRLQTSFYDGSPAAERVAAAVLLDLKDFEEGSSTYSH